MIKLQGGKKKWQLKAKLLPFPNSNEFPCTCWECLRRNGITPDRNSHESHRRNILPGSPVFRTDNGEVESLVVA